MNNDFGCYTQPKSMFVAMNIECGFTMKPNCRFTFVKRDFGWGGCCHPARRPHPPPHHTPRITHASPYVEAPPRPIVEPMMRSPAPSALVSAAAMDAPAQAAWSV